jgi:TonB family protein
LQRIAKQGEQRSVQVGGIYITGFEGSVLADAACPDQSTWVELDLKSTANKEQLRSMLDAAGKADVVFEGEFYGPGMPSPNLPEAIRKSYQPGWGHLGAFKTKLVVHAIQSVKPVSADHPGSADLSQQVPILQAAEQPKYPPIAKAAHITGKVIVRVTVKEGQVVSTEVVSKLDPGGQRFLETATVANLKTWRFAADVNGEFPVTYSYSIAGDETDNPTNPRVEMLPSLDVNITARPVKPTVNYGAQSVPATDTLAHESGHVVDPPKPQ